MRDYQLNTMHLPRAQVYNQTMYILVGFLVIGFICNLLVKPVDPKYFMNDAELAEEKRLAHERSAASEAGAGVPASATTSSPSTVVLAWAAVGIPLAWGVYVTLVNAAKFFG
jgi:hypothetical protein